MYRETSDDLNKKWTGGFCLYDRNVFQFSEFRQMDDESVMGLGVYWNNNKEKVSFKHIVDPALFSEIVIPPGFYNIGLEVSTAFWGTKATMAIRVDRLPHRSPCRCFNTRSYACVNPISVLIPIGSNIGGQWNTQILNDIFDSKRMDYEEAIQQLDKNRAIAVSRNFAVVLSPTQDDPRPLLFDRWGIIGRASPGLIEVFHAPAYQEVLDFRSRFGLAARVECRQMTD